MSSEFGPSSCTTSSVSARASARAKGGATADIPATPRPPSTTLRRLVWKDEALIDVPARKFVGDREARPMPSARPDRYGVTAPRLTARGAVSSFQVELATCTGENAGRST